MRPQTATLRVSRVLAFLFIVASASCQSGTPQATSAPASAPATTPSALPSARPSIPAQKLKGVGIEIWHPWYGAEASLLESQMAVFNQSNEWGITVRDKGHTSFTELFDDVTGALSDASAPQLVIALPEHALAWDARGAVVDMSAYVADPTYGLDADAVGDFRDIFWQQEIIAGRQLGLPAQRSALFFTYNQTWAKQLGFAEPPATPAEFRDQACAAHRALLTDDSPANDAMGGWQIRTDAATFVSWLTAFGGGIVDGNGYRFLSPRNLEATVFLKQLFDDGCAWLPSAGQETGSAFASRSALFSTAGMEELSDYGRAMASAENTDSWTLLGFPAVGQPVIMLYGSSFIVLKSTPEQQLAAWLFVRWLVDPARQEKWVEVTGLLPIRTSTADRMDDYARAHPQWVAALDLASTAQIEPQLESWRQVRVMIGDGFDAMFRSNTPAGRVAEILAIMDRTARDIME